MTGEGRAGLAVAHDGEARTAAMHPEHRHHCKRVKFDCLILLDLCGLPRRGLQAARASVRWTRDSQQGGFVRVLAAAAAG